MKSLELTLTVLKEYGELLKIDTRRDCETIRSRVAAEGESFLTITLPRLEKELLAFLDFKRASSDLFVGFKRRGGLPAFLQGFLRQLTSHDDGFTPHKRPPTRHEALVLQGLRQILSLQGKIFEVSPPDRVDNAVSGFYDTERSLQHYPGTPSSFIALFEREFGAALSKIEKRLFEEQFVGRNGPGAVADKQSPNQRWLFDAWPHNLQRVVPFWELMPVGQLIDGDVPQIVPRPSSRLIAVPKTRATPRLISIEPWQHQFVQQGLLDLLTKELSRLPCWLQMGWTDQSRNARLAEAGSQDRSLATLDLSEASDRVHKQLVWDLLSNHKYLREWIFSCRSAHVSTPKGSLELQKFASMGSALTFPIECMVFYTIALAGCVSSSSDQRRVSVYGDDIVVPSAASSDVIALLEKSLFKVNHSKSFTTGWFRESCGSDWFGGYNTNIVRVRHSIDDTRTGQGLEKAIGLRNRLFTAGLFGTVAYLDTFLGHVPYGPPGTPHLARYTFDLEKVKTRFNRPLQRLEFQVISLDRRKPFDELAGWQALNKCLTLRQFTREPLSADHLIRAGRPSSGRVQKRWAALA